MKKNLKNKYNNDKFIKNLKIKIKINFSISDSRKKKTKKRITN